MINLDSQKSGGAITLPAVPVALALVPSLLFCMAEWLLAFSPINKSNAISLTYCPINQYCSLSCRHWEDFEGGIWNGTR